MTRVGRPLHPGGRWMRRSLARAPFGGVDAVVREVEVRLDVAGDGNEVTTLTRTAFGATGDQAFRFIRQAVFSGKAGELRFTQRDGKTVVEGDVNGDGTADLTIELAGRIALTGGDFLL